MIIFEILRVNIQIWKMNEDKTELIPTGPVLAGGSGDLQNLNVLHCNAENPLGNGPLNHFRPVQR